jgi:hypothetical protein
MMGNTYLVHAHRNDCSKVAVADSMDRIIKRFVDQAKKPALEVRMVVDSIALSHISICAVK